MLTEVDAPRGLFLNVDSAELKEDVRGRFLPAPLLSLSRRPRLAGGPMPHAVVGQDVSRDWMSPTAKSFTRIAKLSNVA